MNTPSHRSTESLQPAVVTHLAKPQAHAQPVTGTLSTRFWPLYLLNISHLLNRPQIVPSNSRWCLDTSGGATPQPITGTPHPCPQQTTVGLSTPPSQYRSLLRIALWFPQCHLTSYTCLLPATSHTTSQLSYSGARWHGWPTPMLSRPVVKFSCPCST
jgi:hypothetical protein